MMESLGARQKLERLRAALKSFFKERDDAVDGILVALLSRQHILLIGPPGTAKSMLARAVCGAIEGARYFYYLLDKLTTPRDLLVGDVLIVETGQGNNGRVIREAVEPDRATCGGAEPRRVAHWERIHPHDGRSKRLRHSTSQGRQANAPTEWRRRAGNWRPGGTLRRSFRQVFLKCLKLSARGQSGRSRRHIRFINREGPLPQAHVVVLDEIFKAGAPTLNSLLLLLNEREYSINAGEVKHSPLCTLVGASNELPGKERDDLAAFADRFLLRFEVRYLSVSHPESTAFVDMLKGGDWPKMPVVSLQELAALQADAAAVPISDELLWAVNDIRATLALQHGIQPSDRRYKEAIKVVKAFAFLNGHNKVEREDLAFFEHILWSSRERSERDIVRKAVYEVTRDRDLTWASKLYQEAEEIHREAVDLLRSRVDLLPIDDKANARRAEMLATADKRYERLGEISRTLEQLCEGRTTSPSGATTIRTLMNQVTIFRRNLVKMFEIENSLIGV